MARMGPEQEDPQMRREREAAEMRARAAAWENEKMEAAENKVQLNVAPDCACLIGPS